MLYKRAWHNPTVDYSYRNPDWLRHEYLDEKRSSEEITRRCGLRSASTIRSALKRFGIRTRTLSESRRLWPPQNESNWRGGRYKSHGYIFIHVPNHPFASQKYVKEHRLVAEAAIGRYLAPRHIVHHVNGKCDDNRSENLVICEDAAYHRFLHERMKRMKSRAISKES